MNVVIGFTGTQAGMTDAQLVALDALVKAVSVVPDGSSVIGLHGDCCGADVEFDIVCKDHGIATFCRPCTIDWKRAYCCPVIEGAEPIPPLERNQDIVDDSSIMFATPKENGEVLRSGTWSTIRRMRKAKKPLYIIYPNGKVEK